MIPDDAREKFIEWLSAQAWSVDVWHKGLLENAYRHAYNEGYRAAREKAVAALEKIKG